MNVKRHIAICAALSVCLVAAPASAVVNLNLGVSTSPISQSNLDCVFQASTCPNGVYGLAELSNYGTNVNSYSGTSLTYYVGSGGSAGFNLPFNKFDIEIDSASSSAATDRLTLFQVFVNGNLEYQYTYSLAAGNIPGGNGNSNADYRFTGIDLSAFGAGSSVYFNVAMDNLTGGPESFIWYNGSTVVTAVPEPAELALMIAGLGVVTWRKRLLIVRVKAGLS